MYGIKKDIEYERGVFEQEQKVKYKERILWRLFELLKQNQHREIEEAMKIWKRQLKKYQQRVQVGAKKLFRIMSSKNMTRSAFNKIVIETKVGLPWYQKQVDTSIIKKRKATVFKNLQFQIASISLSEELLIKKSFCSLLLNTYLSRSINSQAKYMNGAHNNMKSFFKKLLLSEFIIQTKESKTEHTQIKPLKEEIARKIKNFNLTIIIQKFRKLGLKPLKSYFQHWKFLPHHPPNTLFTLLHTSHLKSLRLTFNTLKFPSHTLTTLKLQKISLQNTQAHLLSTKSQSKSTYFSTQKSCSQSNFLCCHRIYKKFLKHKLKSALHTWKILTAHRRKILDLLLKILSKGEHKVKSKFLQLWVKEIRCDTVENFVSQKVTLKREQQVKGKVFRILKGERKVDRVKVLERFLWR